MSQTESGEIAPKPVILNRQTLIPAGLVIGAVFTAGVAITTAVFGHETRITVLEADAKNDRITGAATDKRIEETLKELRADVKKLLEKP